MALHASSGKKPEIKVPPPRMKLNKFSLYEQKINQTLLG